MKFLFAISIVLSLPLLGQSTEAPKLSELMEDVIHDIYRIDADELREYLSYDVQPKYIAAADLKQLMEADPNLKVINVLSAKWYDDCHIAGSINVPLKELVPTVHDWDREQSIVVYCALDECDASEKAYLLLDYLGFKSVLDYKGGIKEWLQLDYSVSGPCAAEYLRHRGHKISDC